MHPISQIVERRLMGALETMKALTPLNLPSSRYGQMISARRDYFLDLLNESVTSEGAMDESRSIQHRIGQMQVLQDLRDGEISPQVLQQQYQSQLDELRSNPELVPVASSVWNSTTDRIIAPTERGFALIDSLSRSRRRHVNQLHGVLQVHENLGEQLDDVQEAPRSRYARVRGLFTRHFIRSLRRPRLTRPNSESLRSTLLTIISFA